MWLYDLERQLFSRRTVEGRTAAPCWSADGQSIYCTVLDTAAQQSLLMRKPVDGSGEAVALTTIPGRAYLGHVDREERFAIVAAVPPGQTSNIDILRVPMAPPGTPQPIIATAALDYAPAVSPDGRWLAYVSTASGVQEIWVREMNGTGRWQISTSGGLGPRWSPDGRELFFQRDTRQMAVTVETTSHFRAGQERRLFDGAFDWRTEAGMSYTVDPATGRFLMILPPLTGDASAQPTVRVIANWASSLPAERRR